MPVIMREGAFTKYFFIGGIVPDEDAPRLKELGITGIYGPGASTEDIVRDIREAIK